jgi:DNA-binding beta-propeller fold protein YncE
MGVEVVARRASPKSRHEDAPGDQDELPARSVTIGLVPTGWYPTGVATSPNGGTWYVINAKSPLGPNSGWCLEMDPIKNHCEAGVGARTIPPLASNGIAPLLAKNLHVNQLEKAGFLTLPAPDSLELARLTKQVAHNNRFDRPEKTEADERLFSVLRQHIKHVIYIMKENRTYDQVLGDLEIGNGDRRLTIFPAAISPNHHAIARNFVTLDNLLASAEGSMTGRDWTFAAQTNDMQERNDPLVLATAYKGESGGFPYETDRFANTAFSTGKKRNEIDPFHTADPDILPGTNRVYGLDGPGGEAGTGYLWDAALRSGLFVRNYGLYEPIDRRAPVRDFRAEGRKVLSAMTPSLEAHTDPYYSMNQIADFWRVREWKREFDGFVAKKDAPNLTLLYLVNDHLGDFDLALDGVNTPETQMADNDYALGLVLEAVALSPFANDTLVVSIEDDASDGPDHVSSQRTVALFAGPHVRQYAVVSTRYTTVNVVKTIEKILGIGPIGLNDALAAPMSDVFDPSIATWSYKAIVPDVLRSTQLPLPPADHAYHAVPKHSAAYWTKAMAGQDFSGPDRIDAPSFNRALWRGLKGDAPYPDTRTGADLRKNRSQLLGKTRADHTR